jgi:aldehyde dehydrogenase
MDSVLVADVVAEVMRRLGQKNGGIKAGEDSPANDPPRAAAGKRPKPPAVPIGSLGVYDTIDAAVRAATQAQVKLTALSLDDRDAIVKLLKSISSEKAHEWGALEFAETQIGRLDHKIEKLQMLAGIPGVEFLRTPAYTGTKGMSLDEHAPFGVIGCITPVTHSIPTLTCNAINMIAAGNALVINAHPSGANCAAVAIREYNQQIAAGFGIDNLLTCVLPPTLETAEALFSHRDVALLVVTGGAQVARAALAAKKRAIVAGPGNPPVVVDETACLANAAESIIKGAAYDNNLLCIGEKEVFCVQSVFEQLVAQMERHGGFRLDAGQIERLTRVAFRAHPRDGHPVVSKDFVGKDPSVLAEAAGVKIPPTTQLLFGQTSFEHPFVQEEQMMPFVPLVPVKDVDEAIELALKAEHGFRHTAIIHSKRIDAIAKFSRLANVTIFVANGSSLAGLGSGGEGWGSYSIATPTGEGITNPLTFTRFRRVAVAGMRFV